MSFAQALIDKACGGVLSQRQLAAKLGEDQAFLSRVARGLTPLPPGLAARLADAAHEDPVDAVLRAVVDHERDDAKRASVAKALHVKEWRRR